jgi:hypothetical protein
MSFATTATTWADDLIATLSFSDCRFVVAYNAQDIINNQTAYNGLQLALKRQYKP